MRRRALLAVLAGAVAAWGAVPVAVPDVAAASAGSAAGAVRAAGTWGRAFAVPGLGALNKGGDAHVLSVSCASAGNCAAGGYYLNSSRSSGFREAFVVSELHGVWRRAIEVRSTSSVLVDAQVTSVSCASAGNCAAVGFDSNSDSRPAPAQRATGTAPSAWRRQSGDMVHRWQKGTRPDGGTFHGQGFVISERHGVWRRAIEVPGLATLDEGGEGVVLSVSCASAGNCVAGGYYFNPAGTIAAAFVAAERNGVWHRAFRVPGIAGLIPGDVNSVSCASAGNCVVGGQYYDGHNYQGYVAAERNGVWHHAFEIPGLGALNTSGLAEVDSVSCASAGNCVVGGLYTLFHRVTHGFVRITQGFVAAERNGVWHRAFEVPGLGALNAGGYAYVGSVSCASAGNCVVGGQYYSRPGKRGFVASERNGVWHRAFQVPNLGAPNAKRNAAVTSVSCASAGNCTVGGRYTDSSGHVQGFVVSQQHGVWHHLTGEPGRGILHMGGNGVSSVSCARAGTCLAGGYYTSPSRHHQGFLVARTR